MSSLLVLAAASAAGGTAAGSAARCGEGRLVTLGYRSRAALQGAVALGDARVSRLIPSIRVAAVRPKGCVGEFARAAREVPGIAWVQATVSRRSAGEPALTPGLASTPGGAYEWQYTATHADRVPASVLRAARAITIAVVDTGADVSAPDLASKSPRVYDVRTGAARAPDSDGHGTFVASLAAGAEGNDEGMVGFGGDAKLLVVKASAPNGRLTDVDVAAGVVYAVDHGAKIVNLSLSSPVPSLAERAAIAYAIGRGTLVVVAAGNGFRDGNPLEYPAAYLPALELSARAGAGLAVAASNAAGERSGFSSTGSYVSLAAPGESVFGAVASSSSPERFARVRLPGSHSGLYGFASGTSFAAPEVAGAAALVWAADPSLTAAKVAAILEHTASGDGTWNPELGFGVIDVASAVAQARAATKVEVRAARRG